MKTKMNYGAHGSIFGRAKQLRGKQTFAEILLWSRLRNNQLGVRFRRQHPMDKYVVDFYCDTYKLVVEVDGNVHQDKMVQLEDATKEESLISMGLFVMRFSNQKVIDHLDEVVEIIKQKLQELEDKSTNS